MSNAMSTRVKGSFQNLRSRTGKLIKGQQPSPEEEERRNRRGIARAKAMFAAQNKRDAERDTNPSPPPKDNRYKENRRMTSEFMETDISSRTLDPRHNLSPAELSAVTPPVELPGSGVPIKTANQIANEELWLTTSRQVPTGNVDNTRGPRDLNSISQEGALIKLLSISNDILAASKYCDEMKNTSQHDPEGAVRTVLAIYNRYRLEAENIRETIDTAARGNMQLQGMESLSLIESVSLIIREYEDLLGAYNEDVLDICHEIKKTARSWQALQQIPLKVPKEAVVRLLVEYDKLARSYQSIRADAHESPTLRSELAIVRNAEKRLSEANSDLRREMERKDGKYIIDHAAAIRKHKEELQKATGKHNEEFQKMREKKEDWKRKYTNLQNAHDGDVEKVKRELRKEYATEIQELKRQLADKEKTYKADLEEEKRKGREGIKIHEEREKELVALMEQLSAEHEIDKRDLEVKLEADFMHKTTDMFDQLQQAKSGLVERKQVKSLPDYVLAERFKAIAVEVQDFSSEFCEPTLRWDNRKVPSFAVPQYVLEQIHPKNTRILKLEIVQNSVWLILHSRIFATPFRVLGDEGTILDDDWMNKFKGRLAKTGEWPPATTDCEQMRYEMAEKCLQAVSSKGQLSDQSRRWRSSYEDCKRDIAQEIAMSVRAITMLDELQMEAVDRIVNSTAMLWLEACSQRYRIMMVMPNQVANHLLADVAPKTMKLLIRPGLNRLGDANGEQLIEEETVAGLTCQLSEEYGKRKARH